MTCDLTTVMEPLFKVWPRDQAMRQVLFAPDAVPEAAVQQVASLTALPALRGRNDLQAALWLYVDRMEPAHTLVQDAHRGTGALWHAILHRREGDFGNSLYWCRQVGHHPVVDSLAISPADLVAQARGQIDAPSEAFIEAQQAEWHALFAWCVQAA